MYSKLQYISQGTTLAQQLENIQQALDAGCDWIQLRFKNASEKELHELAFKIKSLCASYQATFIVNDNVELTKQIDADGVHLGLQDESPLAARVILGKDKIIGGTANTLLDVLKRVEQKCDYVGLGPFSFTKTKEKLSPILGIEGYKKIMYELSKMKLYIPIYAIGGITYDDIESIMNANVYGIAVSGIITLPSHKEKMKLVKKINNLLYGYTQNSR